MAPGFGDDFGWPDEVYADLIEKTKKQDEAKAKQHDKYLQLLKKQQQAQAIKASFNLDIDPKISSPEVGNRKVMHWTGHIDTRACQACGKPKLTGNPDIWVVMKKTWLIHDLNFIRCVEYNYKWDIVRGPINFLGATSGNISIPLETIRNDLLDALKSVPLRSTTSNQIISILAIMENPVAGLTGTVYDEIRKVVPGMIARCNPGTVYLSHLAKVLKAAYLNL